MTLKLQLTVLEMHGILIRHNKKYESSPAEAIHAPDGIVREPFQTRGSICTVEIGRMQASVGLHRAWQAARSP